MVPDNAYSVIRTDLLGYFQPLTGHFYPIHINWKYQRKQEFCSNRGPEFCSESGARVLHQCRVGLCREPNPSVLAAGLAARRNALWLALSLLPFESNV